MNKSSYCSKMVRSVSKPIDISNLFEPITKPLVEPPTPPKGYYTVKQYAEMFDVSERTMQRRIWSLWNRSKEGARVVVKLYPSTNILGNRTKVPYYKVDKISLLK